MYNVLDILSYMCSKAVEYTVKCIPSSTLTLKFLVTTNGYSTLFHTIIYLLSSVYEHMISYNTKIKLRMYLQKCS